MGHPVKLYVYDLSGGMARAMSRQLTGIQIDGIWYVDPYSSPLPSDLNFFLLPTHCVLSPVSMWLPNEGIPLSLCLVRRQNIGRGSRAPLPGRPM